MRRRITTVVAVAATVGALVVPFVATQSASAATNKVYVSPAGEPDNAGTSCGTAKYWTVQYAVDHAPLGSTVVVCPGWYYESVTVDRQVDLAGRPGASIDADGGPYAVGVTVSHVKISGLYVTGASTSVGPGDGIITAGFTMSGPAAADYVTISNNVAEYNEGNGIDLETTQHSSAINNQSRFNGVGINVVNDFGSPAAHNKIISNVASDNYGGCGIVLADHSGAGVYDNLVSGNQADNNGLGTPSAPSASSGSGIILAGSSGGVWNNTIENNSFTNNGHGGVALHAHAPGLNFSGNKIINNSIGTNNVRKDTHDPKTTGIYLGDVSPLTITVTGNFISTDYYGIFTAGPVTVNSVLSNTYSNVSVRLGHAAHYPGLSPI